MKNLFNKLVSLFYTNKKISNYILFELDKDGDIPNVKLKIMDTSDASSEKFAEMLYNINKGIYNQSILDLLLDVGAQDSTINNYINSTIVWWKIFNAQSGNLTTKKHHPIVKPTDFNRYVTK